MKRLSWVLLAALVIAIGIGVAYQSRGETQDAALYPPAGELVSIGPYRLHLNCSGEGSPVVVLEALSGGFSTHWTLVQTELARVTRVCSYDRPGRAWSDAAPPGDLWQTAENLHALLQNARVDGPYILAGHSIGGLYVRAYVARYPKEVEGLALIDSSHPEQFERYPEMDESDGMMAHMLPVFPWLARVGLFRKYFADGGELDFQDLPEPAHAAMTAVWSTSKFFVSLAAEVKISERVFAQAHELGGLGDLPLTVVTAGGQPELWNELQRELTALSTRGVHVTLDGASHSSLVLNPDDARRTASAIAELVGVARP